MKHSEENRPESHSPDAQTPVGKAAFAPARRRLIRGSLAPVVLTLASRPVLAWHCKSPSAWGSEQLNPMTSLATNGAHPSLEDESWTIYNWQTNTARAFLAVPWTALANKVGLTTDPALYQQANYYKKYTVRQLFSDQGLTVPAGLALDRQIWYKLNDQFKNSGGTVVSEPATEFQKYMIVARLNYMLLTNVKTCMSYSGADELNQMAGGLYSPPNLPGTTWTTAEIQSYLYNNWIVRPS